jgi:2-polyprenyl-3-methyl-5-hydroxy-6-metoxy-1,4-benzoquinol methylase
MELLACPACAGPLERLVCSVCDTRYQSPGGIPDLRLSSDRRTEVVREFYSAAPFPGYSPRETLISLRERGRRSEFARLLDEAIPPGARVVELGCGTGQLSLFLATGDRSVIGADLARASLGLGAEAAKRFGVDGVSFVEMDLRRPGLRAGAFDVVVCSGVLHHTPDPRSAFRAVARLLRPGGHVVLGLYNTFARFPHRLRRAVARLTGFRLIPFDPVLRTRRAERERRDAWLRDQYQHPEEHRHTLGEVKRWFCENEIEYLRTYPSALLGSDDSAELGLFTPALDDWPVESFLAQLSWMRTLAAEGGLFVTIGRRCSGARKSPTA